MPDELSGSGFGARVGLPPNTYLPTAEEAISAGMALANSTDEDGQVIRANAGVALGARPYCVGLARYSAAVGTKVHAQYNDILDIPTEQWDAVTGESGGLTVGAPYYVSGTTKGHLTKTPPSSSGTFVIPVGVATGPTSMRLVISFGIANP